MKNDMALRGERPPQKKRLNFEQIFPYLLISPTVILILLIFVFPVFDVFYLSFKNYDLTNVMLKGYAGFENYIKIFTKDPNFYLSLRVTAKWVLLEVVLQLIFGMIVALILNMQFHGRGIVRAVSLVPWAVSGVLTTMLWLLIFDQHVGVLDVVLMRAGIIHQNIAWLSDMHTYFASIVLAELWRGISFFAITLLAGLQTIPTDIYESCALDGCGTFRKFYYITLPFLKESIVFATLLRGIWEFNSIDMIFTMTNGGPMNLTTTLPIYMMKTAIVQGNYGYGSALGGVSFVILLIFAVIYIKITGYGRDLID